MNTTLKPAIKRIECSITRPKTPDLCCLISSTPTPEIIETYPGTRGKTHGDRNDSSPATNAASGSGRIDIDQSSEDLFAGCVLSGLRTWAEKSNRCRLFSF